MWPPGIRLIWASSDQLAFWRADELSNSSKLVRSVGTSSFGANQTESYSSLPQQMHSLVRLQIPTPALALPRTAQLRNPIPPPTQLARKSSLANSRLSRPDLNFATQSSPTKRKQVRLMQHGKEQVPGAGSDRGTPRSSRGTDNQDGRHKRRRLHTGEASEVDGMEANFHHHHHRRRQNKHDDTSRRRIHAHREEAPSLPLE